MNDKECYYTKIALKDLNMDAFDWLFFMGGGGGAGERL